MNEVALPRSFTDQEVRDMTQDEAHAAVARGLLTVFQMQRLLGGPPLTNKKFLRRLLAAEADAAAEAKAAEAAARAKTAAETQAAEAAKRETAASKAAEGGEGSPEMTGLPHEQLPR